MPDQKVDLSQYDLDASGNRINPPVDLSKYDLDASGNPIIRPPGRKLAPSSPAQVVSSDEPDTFWGGVGKSLTSGEALGAGMRGALGYLKGATIDIPSSIYGGIANTAGFAKDVLSDPIGYGSKVAGAISDPMAVGRGIGVGAQDIGNSIMSAGSHPEEFGRTVGQITGQPIVTAGLMKGYQAAKPYVPGAIRAAGPAVESVGRFIKNEGLASGIIPPMATPRYLSHGERFLGRGIEALGKRMSIPTVQGEVIDLPPPTPPYQEGQVIQDQLPPSSTDYYSPDPDATAPPTAVAPEDMGQPIQPKQLPAGPPPRFIVRPGEPPTPSPVNMDDLGRPIPQKQLPPSSTSFYLPENLNPPSMENLGTSVQSAVPTQSPLITIKSGPTGELQVAKAQARGYKLVGIKNGDYIMEAGETAPASTPQATPTQQTTTPPVATPNEPPVTPSIQTKVAAPRRASGRMGSPALNLPKAPTSFVQKIKNFIDDQSGEINFGPDPQLEAGPPNQGNRPASQMDRLRQPTVQPEPTEVGPTYSNNPANEIQPDITQTNQPVPETGGTSPVFTPQTPEPTFAEIQQRMYELTDKGTNGTLTADELQEAQALNKVWRNHPEFGAPPTPPQTSGIPPAPASFMQRIRQFLGDESGSGDIGPEGEKGPIERSLTKRGPQSIGRPNPDMFEAAKRNLDERNAMGDVVDYEDELNNLMEQHGVIDTMSNETQNAVTATRKALDAGYTVIAKESPHVQRMLREGWTIAGEQGGDYVLDYPAGNPHRVGAPYNQGQLPPAPKEFGSQVTGESSEPGKVLPFEKSTPPEPKPYQVTQADVPALERYVQLRDIYRKLGDKMPPEQMTEWAQLHNKYQNAQGGEGLTLSPYKNEPVYEEPPQFTTYILPDGSRVALDTSATKGAQTTTFQMKGGKIVTATKAPEGTPSFGNPQLPKAPKEFGKQVLGEPKSVITNASGESAASQEAINRQSSMKTQGRQFGVYDRAGNFRPLIGPEAVDYTPRKGETYGVKTKDGFQTLEDKGGKVPPTKSGLGTKVKNFMKDESGEFDLDALKKARPSIDSQEHIAEATLTPLRRIKSRIKNIIEENFDNLPDDDWRQKFAKIRGEQLSGEFREQADWADKQGYEYPEQVKETKKIASYFRQVADQLDSVPNTPEKLGILTSLRKFFGSLPGE